jgi:hypothetical protein
VIYDFYCYFFSESATVVNSATTTSTTTSTSTTSTTSTTKSTSTASTTTVSTASTISTTEEPWYKNIFSNFAPFHHFENNHIFDFDPEKDEISTTTKPSTTYYIDEPIFNLNDEDEEDTSLELDDRRLKDMFIRYFEEDSSEENLERNVEDKNENTLREGYRGESIEDSDEKKKKENVDSSSSRYDSENDKTSTVGSDVENSDDDLASNHDDDDWTSNHDDYDWISNHEDDDWSSNDYGDDNLAFTDDDYIRLKPM